MEFEPVPIGVKPDYIWKRERMNELLRAISEYTERGMFKPCVFEWIDEFKSLAEEERDRISNPRNPW